MSDQPGPKDNFTQIKKKYDILTHFDATAPLTHTATKTTSFLMLGAFTLQIVWCCDVLRGAVLCYVVLLGDTMLLFGVIWCFGVIRCCCLVLCGAVLHCLVLCGAVNVVLG